MSNLPLQTLASSKVQGLMCIGNNNNAPSTHARIALDRIPLFLVLIKPDAAISPFMPKLAPPLYSLTTMRFPGTAIIPSPPLSFDNGKRASGQGNVVIALYSLSEDAISRRYAKETLPLALSETAFVGLRVV